MYYIYHIPKVKVGCSINPKRRVKAQGYTDFEILAEAVDKFTAGNLEAQFQKQYGYKVDCVKYYQTNYKSMGHKGGAKTHELGHTKKLQEIGHKIAASLPRTEAQMEQARKVQKIGAKIAWSKPRSEAQMEQARKVQKIGCVLGGRVAGAIVKEKLRVPIAAYRKSDNSYVGEYISVTDCARELNLIPSDIFNCLNTNKTQKTTKGYKFIKLKKQL
jgi:hypothetical protein